LPREFLRWREGSRRSLKHKDGPLKETKLKSFASQPPNQKLQPSIAQSSRFVVRDHKLQCGCTVCAIAISTRKACAMPRMAKPLQNIPIVIA
jgi:hypothetical protein